jgi:hypothetical protein
MLFPELSERPEELKIGGQFADGGGFAAREDQPLDPLQIARQAYFRRVHRQAPENGQVLGKIALQGQDSNLHRAGSKGIEGSLRIQGPEGITTLDPR